MAKAKKICFVFPGMGTQYIGMCKDLAAEYKYIDTFLKESDDYLAPSNDGRKMTDIMWNSDKKTLALVINGCNATLLNSICLWKILQKEYNIDNLFNREDNVLDVAIMGHSLGEMSAMHASGLWKSDQDGLWIQQKFGEIMRSQTEQGQAMCAVVSDPKGKCQPICHGIW